MDLVKISPTAVPPVCKIMDYGKYRYEQSKKEKETRRNQHQSELKEISLSMTIEEHDLKTKAGSAHKFLSRGDKCKVSLRMRGRQQAHSKIGVRVMQDFFALVEDVSAMERPPVIEGRNIIMILVPKAGTAAAKPKDNREGAPKEAQAQRPPKPAAETAATATTSIGAAVAKQGEKKPPQDSQKQAEKKPPQNNQKQAEKKPEKPAVKKG